MNNNNKKSVLYIIGFTAIIVIAVIIFLIAHPTTKDKDTSNGSGGSNQNAASYKPDTTSGDIDGTIDADITFRDVDFSLTKEQILSKEQELTDTLDDPDIASSSDGYEYITFKSNPDNPLSFNGVAVSSGGTSCLTYVLINEALMEVRLQFGHLDSDSRTTLIEGLKSQYGPNTFYRSSEGVETYWWKTTDEWLMLTVDSAGTSVSFRQNK